MRSTSRLLMSNENLTSTTSKFWNYFAFEIFETFFTLVTWNSNLKKICSQWQSFLKNLCSTYFRKRNENLTSTTSKFWNCFGFKIFEIFFSHLWRKIQTWKICSQLQSFLKNLCSTYFRKYVELHEQKDARK